MAIEKDPVGNETRALIDMIDFKNRRVLEVGCGDGRLTWRYADLAEHITAIDPIESEIKIAQLNLPARLIGKVEFHETTLEDFGKTINIPSFDLAIFSWSL